VDRARGKTKLSFLTLLETLVMALQFKRRFTPLAVARPTKKRTP